METISGNFALCGSHPTENADVVQKVCLESIRLCLLILIDAQLIAAGAIVLGKTSLSVESPKVLFHLQRW